ncbi:MAG TPA: hypothetical protein VMU69_01395 [Bradyrhizobium sp.]|nr:hypothetical protein [Bradyrhizobium sp.]
MALPTLVWRALPDGNIDYVNKRLLEPDVRARRDIHRSQQLDWMAELGRALAAGDANIENRALALLMIERVADAIADRELVALDLDVGGIRAKLASSVEALLLGGGD